MRIYSDLDIFDNRAKATTSSCKSSGTRVFNSSVHFPAGSLWPVLMFKTSKKKKKSPRPVKGEGKRRQKEPSRGSLGGSRGRAVKVIYNVRQLELPLAGGSQSFK